VSKTHSQAFGAPGGNPEILFNFDADTLYIGWDVCGIAANMDRPEDLGFDRFRVKKLALSDCTPSDIILQFEEADLICQLLEWFSNIQELIIVPEHAEDCDGSAELIWTDNPVTEPRLYHYKHSFDIRDDREWNLAVASREHRETLEFDSLIIEIIRLKRMYERRGKPLSWAMPQTHWKYITTPGMKTEFEEAKHAYDEERRLFHTRVNLVCASHPTKYTPLVQVVTQATTVKELASAFGAKRGIPCYMKIEFRQIQEEYSTPILACENFSIGRDLILHVTEAA
jgi:hypothetical protein